MMEKNNIIAIRISHQSLSFAAEDSEAANGLSYEPYIINSSISMAANLREAFVRSTLLLRNYRRAVVFIDSPVMILPTEEFREDEKELLYEHTFTKKYLHVVTHAVIPELSVVAIFSIERDIKNVIDDHFADVRYLPLPMPAWSFLHNRSYNNLNKKLYAYFHDQKMEVFSFSQNRFKFCNCFKVASHQDALYFLTSVWQQLGFNQEKDELHFVGHIDKQDEFLNEAKEFLNNVYMIRPKADFNRHPFCETPALPYDLMVYFVEKQIS